MQILLADYGRASHHCKDPEILGRQYGLAKAALFQLSDVCNTSHEYFLRHNRAA
jgi:hypothetical protein